jgi:hypothetical protein
MNDKQQQDNDGGKSSGISHPKQQSADMGTEGDQSGANDRGQGFAQIDDAKDK